MIRPTPLRNFGICAHIDSGKTTLTERILFYSGKIHRMNEVRGKSGVGATMDTTEIEKIRGISIQSAVTTVTWPTPDNSTVDMNIIDTPGHVDFTIEVERALLVLDGAVLVVCAAGGVQSQAQTVARQLKRYNVPCLAFVNKMDLKAADFANVVSQLRMRLRHRPAVVQLPIGAADTFEGVIDLVEMNAVYCHGDQNQYVEHQPIPQDYIEVSQRLRDDLLETLALADEGFADTVLNGDPTNEQIYAALRQATIRRELTPVLCGSAYQNIGVQPLLDAVYRYLPAPEDCVNYAYLSR